MNIILQHYNGKLAGVAKDSVDNISAYAKSIGVEHKLITGKPWKGWLSDQSQKLCFLMPEYDEYDNVVMLDCDMFTHRENKSNIFEAKGMGRHTKIQSELREKIATRNGLLANHAAPYWGGAIYKFDRETRIRLRSAIPTDQILGQLDRQLKDESIMHYLAWKSGLPETEDTYFNGIGKGNEWDMNSFDDVSRAYIIHIRPKWTLQGPKTTKKEVLAKLVEQCVI